MDAMGRGERLVGREDVMAAFIAALDDARAGAGQLLLISGEAGIGKSAVLSFVADAAQTEGRVLRGFCVAGSGVPPYWPWIQVMRASGLPADDLGEADRLLETSDGTTEPGGVLAAADARFRLHDAIGRVLTALAADGPVVVVLDDLHWADEQSLAALAFLAKAMAGDGVLMVGAYRDNEAPSALLALTTQSHHLPLTGLSLAQAQAMVAALPGTPPPPELTADVWRRSGGNPFFLRELTRLIQAQGGAQLPGHLPTGVIETVRRRLARLPSECAHLLEWAAVAGRDIDIPLLVESGAAADEGSAIDLLSRARRAGIVSPDDPPRFTHDLFRDAILEGQGGNAGAAINLAIGQALRSRSEPGNAARIAAHLLSAGPVARRDAAVYSIRAARQATARLGHDDACSHYQRALTLLDGDDPGRVGVLLELAAAQDRNGSADGARARYRDAADAARKAGDAVTLARAALGMQALGARSGAHSAEVLDLLGEADVLLASLPAEDPADGAAGGRRAQHSRVLAAITRVLRHGSDTGSGPQLIATANRAVELAALSGDATALAGAKLALHDAEWVPGSAATRLPIAGEMLAAALRAGDAELVALAHQLRAAALLELGDPAGRDELLTYITLAEQLGNARGRWGALTRRATYAAIAGRAVEAAEFAQEALELGTAIGEPDALGCFCTLRWSLVALGVDESTLMMDAADPLWPMFPVLTAWPHAARGDLERARDLLGDFSVLDVTMWTGLESLAAAAVVFAAVGSEEQRRWAYEHLLPFADQHVVVGGCASYHATVEHHLGTLAAALGDRAAAEDHLRNAIAMQRRLGAAGWVRVTQRALDRLPEPEVLSDNEFRLVDGRWILGYAGRTAMLPDAKGLHDLAAVLAAKGADVHVRDLLGPQAAPAIAGTGADPVLDERAKAEYRARLATLAGQIGEAGELGHTARAGRLADERDALIRELAAASGFGGRDRRLGDEIERARKTVGARLRDSLTKIDRVHPLLAAHLRASVRMGTTCSYNPAMSMAWKLS